MIKRAIVKHFKGLSDFEVGDLAQVTLIGGRNNVGKTSFLEALFLVLDRLNPDSFLRQHRWRGIEIEHMNPDSIWVPMFSMYQTEQPIEIRLIEENGQESILTLKMMGSLSNLSKAIDSGGNQGTRPYLDMTYQPDSTATEKIQQIIEPKGSGIAIDSTKAGTVQKPGFIITASGRLTPQESAIHFGKLEIADKHHEVIDFLRETVEPRLRGLSTIAVGNQSLIHAQLEGFSRKIPIAYLGDGMARLLSVILVISNTSDDCVFIDEIENGIHYSAMPKVWLGIVKAAQRFNCQVFATTHSYECLQAAVQGLTEDVRDQFCYVRLDRNGDRVVGTTYDYEVLSAALEQNWEVR